MSDIDQGWDPDPLRQMVFASAVTVDTALKQDARGFNATSFLDFG